MCHNNIGFGFRNFVIRLCALFFFVELGQGNLLAISTYWQSHVIRHLGQNEGLPYNLVDDICTDSDGFVYLATGGGGLLRYDGYSFVPFSRSTHADFPSDFVFAVAADQNGILWVGTECGLALVDPRQHSILPLKLNSEASERDSVNLSQLKCSVSHIVIDDQNHAWVATTHSIVCLELAADGTLSVVGQADFTDGITALQSTQRGVAVALGAQLYIATLDRHHHMSIRPFEHSIPNRSALVINCLMESNGFLWVGTNLGLFRINSATGANQAFYHSDADPTTLTQNHITDIATDADGRIVVATLKGLNVFVHSNASFERVTQDDDVPGNALCSNFINCLHSTPQGLWVGTDVSGADFISPMTLELANTTTDNICGIKKNQAKGQVSTIRPVNAIEEDADGTVWLGIIEGGLARRQRGAQDFELFNIQNHGLCHNSVSALALDNAGQLWVGTWGGGLDVVNRTTPSCPVTRHYAGSPNDLSFLSSDFIGSLKYDPINQGVWVGTIHGIEFIDAKGNICHPIPSDAFKDMNGALGADIDSKGLLWMGTSIGVFVIDLHTMVAGGNAVTYKQISHKLNDPNVTGDPRITFVYHSTQQQKLFVCTNGMGLFVHSDADPDDQWDVYDASNGLANNCAVSVAEDTDGNVWVTTNNGLCLLNTSSGIIRTFSHADGLLSDCFYWNAAHSSLSKGRVLLGSLSGLTEVGALRANSAFMSKRPPVITRLFVNNQEVVPSPDGVIDQSIEQTEAISIHEADKSFAVQFSSFNFVDPSSVLFQYRLDGFDDRWLTVPKGQNMVQYTSLQPQDYTLRIRYATSDGTWSNERTLDITVRPFLYRSPWFYLVLLVVAVLIIRVVFRFRLRYVEESRKLLKEQVKERTAELEAQKDSLEQQRAELEQKNQKLIDQNNYITQQKENILEMTAKIQRLSIDKLQFFTNVSHELRSPLTLISGPCRRALSLSTQPEVTEQLQLIDRSAHILLETVNQLMDFRRVDSVGVQVHPVSTDLRAFVGNMVAPYVAYAAEQNIVLNVFYRIACPIVRFDPDAISKILSNLLSNAIKYSDGARRIDLFVCQILRDEALWTYICVRDRGRGIPADQVDKVFDRFYRAKSLNTPESLSSQSTGIGLYLVKNIVTQCNGEVYARNNQAGGLSMRVFLPTPSGSAPAVTAVANASDNADALNPQAQPHDSANATGSATTIVSDTQTDLGSNPMIGPDAQTTDRLTVLVVDDSADMRFYIRSILSPYYRVIEAKDGVMGLTALAENDVDFIIADLMMPIMDGLEFARKVKADFAYSHTPILILTAQTSNIFQTESYRIGVESYLHKPFDEDMLLARIQGIISCRRNDQKKFLTSLDTADLNIAGVSDDQRFVERVTNFVKAHFSDPEFSIDDIVSEIGCSKSMLHKKMQSIMGQAPGNFIRTYRLNVAREILASKNNSLNVSQVAYEVGFNDPKYFSRCFAKAFGYPPSMIN